MGQTILTIISGLLIFAGLIGSIIPLLPGSPLAWAGLLIYAIFTGFETASITGVAVLGALTLFNVLFDIFGPALATRGYKSSPQSAWGAVIGGVLGIFILGPTLGPVGIFLGPFVGAFVGEYLAVFDKDKALKAARAALVGVVAGTIFQTTVSIAILAYFFVAVFRS